MLFLLYRGDYFTGNTSNHFHKAVAGYVFAVFIKITRGLSLCVTFCQYAFEFFTVAGIQELTNGRF
jgi:hypothetical protein